MLKCLNPLNSLCGLSPLSTLCLQLTEFRDKAESRLILVNYIT